MVLTHKDSYLFSLNNTVFECGMSVCKCVGGRALLNPMGTQRVIIILLGRVNLRAICFHPPFKCVIFNTNFHFPSIHYGSVPYPVLTKRQFPVIGLMAQPAEYYTDIAEVMGSNHI